MDRPRDGTTEDLLALAGVAAAGGLTWWLVGDRLLAAAVAASAVLSMPTALLADIAGPVQLPIISEWLLGPSQTARDLLFAVPFAALDQHGYALTAGGRNAALFALPLLYYAARATAGLRPDVSYRTRHTLETATREQAKVWPTALRALERNPADDSEPETEVDPERMQLILRAHEYCHMMGGGVGAALPDLDPPEESPCRAPDVDLAVRLAGQARWAEVAAMLADAGWRPAAGEGCWHSRFEALLVGERWEEARLACFMAGNQQQPPATGSFLLPPLPDITEPPPLGRALRPEEWCDARCLRTEEGDCDPLAIETCLAEQLTRHFTSPEELQPHERALVACVAEFRADDSRELVDMLAASMAPCCRPGDVARVLAAREDLSGRIGETLRTHGGMMTGLAAGHAWVETALLEMWRAGRQDCGILPPAALLWLKGEDRTLWYTIQCVGGNALIEAAGVHAHHRAELQYGMPLKVPCVQLAARALLDIYLDRSPDRWRQPGPGDFEPDRDHGEAV